VKCLASADVVTLARPADDDPDQLEVIVATRSAEREPIGPRYPKVDSLAWQAMRVMGLSFKRLTNNLSFICIFALMCR
jgi:hypothetical protein